MAIKIFPGFRWVLLRAFFHWVVIILMLLSVYVMIENALYVFIVGSGLIALYVGIFYVQMKTPLISFDDDIIIVSNFFYKGLKKISKAQLLSIDTDVNCNNIVINIKGNEPIKVSFKGMSKGCMDDAHDKIGDIIKYQSFD